MRVYVCSRRCFSLGPQVTIDACAHSVVCSTQSKNYARIWVSSPEFLFWFVGEKRCLYTSVAFSMKLNTHTRIWITWQDVFLWFAGQRRCMCTSVECSTYEFNTRQATDNRKAQTRFCCAGDSRSNHTSVECLVFDFQTRYRGVLSDDWSES